MEKSSRKIELKQKKLYAAILGGIVLIIGLFVFLNQESTPLAQAPVKQLFDLPSNDIKPENIRLAQIEQFNDIFGDRLQSLEKTVVNLKEEKTLTEVENAKLAQETQNLQTKISILEEELRTKPPLTLSSSSETSLSYTLPPLPMLKTWEPLEPALDRNVVFEIPAGTVVKAVLASGADCSVGVQSPTGPNMTLLRPLDDGKLPRNVRVPLKGSIIIGNAIGNIASERVYIRAERMTLVQRDGSFVETEISAYISGEDGREGLRGVVVDRSGQILTRAAFASFLQGVNQTLQATLNNQVIEKLAEANRPSKTILDSDLYTNSALQGVNTAIDKMAEYYIKRAEQLQPAIQIAAGRVVDIIFTKTVKIGEKDLKKKFDRERERKLKELTHG